MKKTVMMIVLAAGLLCAADNFDADANNKIRDLQKERLAALREVAELSVTLHQNARLSYEEIVKARLELLNAELDASQTHLERVNVSERIVGFWKEVESQAGQNANSGNATAVMTLKAKAARLKSEIDLEREKNRK